jgi:hypothetical protein
MDLNVKDLSKQLSRVEAKLDSLINRSLLIEYALGISKVEVREKPLDSQPVDPNAVETEQ